MERPRWNLAPSELVGLTPERARDLIAECFFHAQRETFTRTKRGLGLDRLDDASLRSDIAGVVRLAFSEAGGDYEHPTSSSLGAVVAILRRSAEAWGTPAEIVDHHARQVLAMLERLGTGA